MQNPTPRLIAKAAGEKKYVGQPCINGHEGIRHVRNNCCVECHKKTKRKTTYAKRGRPRKEDLFVGPKKPKRVVFKPETDTDKWIARSKGNGKRKLRRGLPFSYYRSLINTHCPLLGIELSYALYKGQKTPPNYATLDRVDSNKGYEVGNVQVISHRANTLKNDATIEEMRLMLSNWEKILI